MPASVARDIALRPGTVWHRLVHDPVTGVAMDRTASGYRIPQGLRDDVVARDVTCRAPGCAPTSLQADLAWPERAGRLEVTTPARPWPPPESPPY